MSERKRITQRMREASAEKQAVSISESAQRSRWMVGNGTGIGSSTSRFAECVGRVGYQAAVWIRKTTEMVQRIASVSKVQLLGPDG